MAKFPYPTEVNGGLTIQVLNEIKRVYQFPSPPDVNGVSYSWSSSGLAGG